MLDGLAAERGEQLPFRATTDLDDAVEGADFVFCAIRVGRLEGRVVDEGVPLGHGVLGQETTGPGGICFALRTIPAMVELAETSPSARRDAWLINFTNPAGMVTEAVQQVLGERAVGICDSPSGLCRRVAAALGRTPASCGSTTSASTTSAGCAARTTAGGDRCPSCWPTTPRSAASRRAGCSAPTGCARSG